MGDDGVSIGEGAARRRHGRNERDCNLGRPDEPAAPAHRISPAGDRVSLFAWMTLANGDQTGLADAQTQAVAGKLNRERVWVDPGEAKPITINCWPQGTTSDIPEDQLVVQLASAETITVTGARMAAPAAPPPPPMPERGGDDYKAVEERLGEVRLYRVPIAVTVAGKSQKQVALLRQPSVKVENILRLRPPQGDFSSLPLERLLVTRNRAAEGLGLPLPVGPAPVEPAHHWNLRASGTSAPVEPARQPRGALLLLRAHSRPKRAGWLRANSM